MNKKIFLVTIPATILMAWWLITSLALVSPLFVPSPQASLGGLADALAEGELLTDMSYTLYRVMVGFLLAAVFGTAIGLLMGYSKNVYDTLEFLVDFFRGIPVTALIPLFLLIFGLGDQARIAMIAWAAGFIIIVNTMYGVHHGKKLRIRVAHLTGASSRQLFLKVIFPEALPQIIVGYRVALSMALVIAVATEIFIGTSHGLGKSIMDAQLVYHIPEMYVAIIATGLLGYGLNKILISVENRVVHWKGK